MQSSTLLDRLWRSHVVRELDDGQSLLYVDLHLVHEVTSPQAFSGLRAAGRPVRRPDRTFATLDHNVPTTARHLPMTDTLALAMIEALRGNCETFGVPLFDLDSAEQGIVHVIGPELGLDPAGPDDRVRRQPHHDARRIRRARLRHRHDRSRAGPRDAVHRQAQAEVIAGATGRAVTRRSERQGCGACGRRRARHGGRHAVTSSNSRAR